MTKKFKRGLICSGLSLGAALASLTAVSSKAEAKPQAAPSPTYKTTVETTSQMSTVVGGAKQKALGSIAGFEECRDELSKGIKWAQKDKKGFGQFKSSIADSQMVLSWINECIASPKSCPMTTQDIVKNLGCKKQRKAVMVALSEAEFKAANLSAAKTEVRNLQSRTKKAGGYVYYASVDETTTTTTTTCEIPVPPPVPPLELDYNNENKLFEDNHWEVSKTQEDQLRQWFDEYDSGGYLLTKVEIEASASWVKNTGQALNMTFKQLSKKRAETLAARIKAIGLEDENRVWTDKTALTMDYEGDNGTGANGENPYVGNPSPEDIMKNPIGHYARKDGYQIGSALDIELRKNQYVHVKLYFEPCIVCLEEKFDCKDLKDVMVEAQGSLKSLDIMEAPTDKSVKPKKGKPKKKRVHTRRKPKKHFKNKKPKRRKQPRGPGSPCITGKW